MSAEVLVLGTFHLDNPGLDVINVVVDDVLAPQRQGELADLAARIARFEPTTVCVEWPAHRQDALDERYARYREGSAEPSRNEIDQIGFRVAHARGLDRVHAIDDHTPMAWDGFERYLEGHPDDARRFEEQTEVERAEAVRISAELPNTPLRDALRRLNDEEALRQSLAFYVDLAGTGGIGEHGGADVASSWYARNLRIFSNLCAITEAGDRIFVVYGAGHAPVLRHLLDLSSRHVLADLAPFLT